MHGLTACRTCMVSYEVLWVLLPHAQDDIMDQSGRLVLLTLSTCCLSGCSAGVKPRLKVCSVYREASRYVIDTAVDLDAGIDVDFRLLILIVILIWIFMLMSMLMFMLILILILILISMSILISRVCLFVLCFLDPGALVLQHGGRGVLRGREG